MTDKELGKLKGTDYVAVEAKSMTECVSKSGTQCSLKGSCDKECEHFFQAVTFMRKDNKE